MRIAPFIAAILLPAYLHAQASVWNKAGPAKAGAAKKVGEASSKTRDFKRHLQEWGMDTSYRKAFMAGGKLNTDGWSGNLYFAKRKHGNVNTLWQVTFSEAKHEKQVKQQGTNTTHPELGNPSSYVFGKVNNLYTLQVGLGRETVLLPGVMEGNISVSMRYSAGLSLAMLKPYFLKMLDIDYSTVPEKVNIKEGGYSRADSALFMNPSRIFGASKWGTSLGFIDYVPGAFIEAAVVIIPGKGKTFVQNITLGCNASTYYKPLPIMQGQQAYPWEICLFAGLAIGKRW